MSSRRRRKLARLRGYGKQSRPTRARGLKLYVEEQHGLVPVVAPHAGAWVETDTGIHEVRGSNPVVGPRRVQPISVTALCLYGDGDNVILTAAIWGIAYPVAPLRPAE